jgi:Cytochrome oxidase complex assembly protein 1
MKSPPFPASRALPVQPRPRTWFERWLVTILIVVAVFIIVAFVGALLYGIEYAFHASYPYQFAVQRAADSPAVAEKIGVPLDIGWLVLGNINSSGREGSTTMSIPISGPYAVGHIIVVANKRANQWKFEILEVEVNGQDERIPLLEAAPAKSPDTNGDPT